MTGGAAFVQDLRLPGMVHGRVVRPPRYGARLDSFDEAKVKAMPGVIAVVRDGSFLGVVAQREEQAINARLVLIEFAKWSGGSELPDPAKMYEQLMSLRSEDRVIGEKDAPVPAGAKVIEATYHRPYQAHAAIAPSCAVAELKDGKLTVWTHSQGVFPLRATIARALGLRAARHPLHPRRRAPAATVTTAPTTSPSTPPCWRAPSMGGRCGCNGCVTTSSSGSPTALP